MNLCEDSNFLLACGWLGEIQVFFIQSCWERCSINLDLNSVPLLECSILGKLNFSIISKNKCVATVFVFLSSIGVVIR